MRTSELVANGIAATTLSRLGRGGQIHKLSRGLYQLAEAQLDANHDLAEAAKRVPKGVVCLTSALAFHHLTDQIPRSLWLAIGNKDWKPAPHGPKLRIVRFPEEQLISDVETHAIEGVPVRVFTIPRTLADCFRFRRAVGLPVAIEALRDALRQRRTSASDVAEQARRLGSWRIIEPYLQAFTIDG